MPEAVATPDLLAVKTRQQTAWSSGDYATIGVTLQIVGETLCEALDLHAGWSVLDVAAGNGNASLAAARRACRVTSTDYVPALLERGKARAEADGLKIVFEEADAENLPFAPASFDAAISTFGIMFTPDQPRAAAEIFRVVKPGGPIGLANWTPPSFVGQIFKTLGKFIPPPAGVNPPSLWGTEARLHELFPHATSIAANPRICTMRAVSPQHWLDTFRTFYGPMYKAYAALDAEGQARLSADLLALIATLNRATDGTAIIPCEYLEVIITK